MDTQYDCNICLNIIDNNTDNDNNNVKLICNHTFHKGCILKWIDTQRKKKKKSTCPTCRHLINKYILEEHYYSNKNIDIKNNNSLMGNNDSLLGNNNSFVVNHLLSINHFLNRFNNIGSSRKKLINQEPIYFLRINDKKWNIPIYRYENMNIDYYLRFLIINNMYDKDKIYTYTTDFSDTIYTSNNNCNLLSKKDLDILVEWIDQMLYQFSRIFNLNFSNKTYNLIIDLLYMTILKLSIIDKKKYQTIAIATIYSIVTITNNDNSILYITDEKEKHRFLKYVVMDNDCYINDAIDNSGNKIYFVNLDFDILNYYSKNSSSEKYFNEFIVFQKNYLDKNYNIVYS